MGNKSDNERAVVAAVTAIDCAHTALKRGIGQLRRLDRVDVEAMVIGLDGVLDQVKTATELLKAAKRLAPSDDNPDRVE